MSDDKQKSNNKETKNNNEDNIVNGGHEGNEESNELREEGSQGNASTKESKEIEEAKETNESQAAEEAKGAEVNATNDNASEPLELAEGLNNNAQSADDSGTKQTTNNLPHSALFVLHTEKGNVSVNRRCHLPRSKGVNVKARRKLLIASILCLFFVFCEVIGGIISNSLAVAADAAHTMTDFAGFMISLFAIWLAGRDATDRLSFGWYRAEVIGALVSVMTIWFVTAILVWMAIQRCINKDFDIDAIVMIIVAVFGIVTNIILAIYLSYGASTVEVNCESHEGLLTHGHNHSHMNGRVHQHHHPHGSGLCAKFKEKFMKLFKIKSEPQSSDVNDSRQDKHRPGNDNLNVKAAYLHVLGDGLQSVSVLIAAIIIYLRPSWTLADPICTFLFSVIILYTTYNILKDIIVVLMEGTPTYMDYNAVQSTFEEIPGIKSIHNLRIWALSMDKIALAVHLVIEPGHDPGEVLIKAEETIHTHYNLFETTIQIEEEGYERPSLVN